MNLAWTAATDDVAVAAYRVYRSAAAFVPSAGTLVATTTGRSFVDTARPVGTWHYAVVAVDAAGNTSLAATSTAVVADITAPAAPVPTVTVSGSSVTVTWPAADDNVATRLYDVYRSATPFAPDASTFVGSTATTSFVDGSRPYGTWFYVVVAVDAAGQPLRPQRRRRDDGRRHRAAVGPVRRRHRHRRRHRDRHVVRCDRRRRRRGVRGPPLRLALHPGRGHPGRHLDLDVPRRRGPQRRHLVLRRHRDRRLGNRSAASALVPVYVPDVDAPTAPAVTGSATGSLVSLSWTPSSDNLGVAGYTVSRLVGGSLTQVGSVTGTTFTEAVADGSWLYLVSARDAAGNLSDAGSVTVTVAATLVQVVRASADTWVNSSAPTKNYGSSNALTTRGTAATVSYLKFAMPAAPVGRTLATVVLSFRTTTSSGAGATTPQYVRITSDAWTERTVTWNAKPSYTGTLVGTLGAAPAVSTTYRVGLVASTLLAARSAAGNVNVALVGSGSDLMTFASSENSAAGSQPTLTFTWR